MFPESVYVEYTRRGVRNNSGQIVTPTPTSCLHFTTLISHRVELRLVSTG